MNAHLELLWNAAFKPSAAVDLARQHPSPYRLGWIYVGILTVGIFVCETLAKYVLRPAFQTPTEPSTPGLEWMDTVLGNTLMAAVCYGAMFVFQRWFWKKFIDANVPQQSIDACLVAGFAISAIIMLPEYLVTEALGSIGLILPLVGLLFFVAIGLAYYTFYFSHGLGLSKTKSFWINLLIAVLFLVFLIFALVAYNFLYAALTGTSVFFMFGLHEVNIDV
jgi:hypothetical protein